MKWTVLAACLLVPVSLHAQTTSPAVKPLNQTPANVQIINGKRFFSLQNVRHFNGSVNSPKAMSVLHHPREAGARAARSGQAGSRDVGALSEQSFPLPGPRPGAARPNIGFGPARPDITRPGATAPGVARPGLTSSPGAQAAKLPPAASDQVLSIFTPDDQARSLSPSR